jgi:hypothetical protein
MPKYFRQFSGRPTFKRKFHNYHIVYEEQLEVIRLQTEVTEVTELAEVPIYANNVE